MFFLRKTMMVLAFILVLFTPRQALSAEEGVVSEEQVEKKNVKIKFATPVLLRFIEGLSSENVEPGQIVKLEVEAPVYVDGILAIPEGTPAKGNIISVSAKNYAGEGGNLAVGNFYLVVNGSQRIDLDGIYRFEGKDKPHSLAIGHCCPLGFLIKGEDAQVKEEQTFRAVVSKDVVLD